MSITIEIVDIPCVLEQLLAEKLFLTDHYSQWIAIEEW